MNKIYKNIFIIFMIIVTIFSTCIVSFADDEDDERGDETEFEERVEEIKNFVEENKVKEKQENEVSNNVTKKRYFKQ